jgi:hypothetical protein
MDAVPEAFNDHARAHFQVGDAHQRLRMNERSGTGT